jgi:hypothetical protein
MANKYDKHVIYLDGLFWWPRPIWISKIIYQATTKAHTATLGTYSWDDTVRATMTAKSCAIADNYTITSAGNFEAAEAVVGDAIWIKSNDSTGVYANRGKYILKTVTDNAVVVIGDYGTTTPLTNDAAGVYSWVTIAPLIAAKLVIHDTYVDTQREDFDPPLWLPNFSLYQISSGAVWIYYN